MPNVTFFISAQEMPPDEALAQLSAQCTRLCTDVLQAALENVHIVYVPVHPGRGHPVFAEIQCRLEPFRTPQCMDAFMEGLDACIQRTTGLSARIRCFGYAATHIHARN